MCLFALIVICRAFSSGLLVFLPCCATVLMCLWFVQAGLHKLELNPYWKDGGTGLPPEEVAGTAATKGNIHTNLSFVGIFFFWPTSPPQLWTASLIPNEKWRRRVAEEFYKSKRTLYKYVCLKRKRSSESVVYGKR